MNHNKTSPTLQNLLGEEFTAYLWRLVDSRDNNTLPHHFTLSVRSMFGQDIQCVLHRQGSYCEEHRVFGVVPVQGEITAERSGFGYEMRLEGTLCAA